MKTLVVTVDLETARVQLADLLSLVAQGNEVIIARGNQRIARLLPIGQSQLRIAGLNPGSILTTPDFDDPLPDEFWLGKECI